MSKTTLAIIKPDAVSNNYQGQILDRILQEGFVVKAMKMTKLTTDQAREFYAVHQDRPFYDDLVNFMTSGPVVPLLLEKEDAVNAFRKLIGSTNPKDAEPGTIRKQFATSLEANAVHGSDSDDNARKEGAFFFTESEIVG